MTGEACTATDLAVVEIARGWLGTPYRHQASCKGAGTDCLGLIRGIWRELRGSEPELVPAYSEDWSETGHREALIEACARHLVPDPAMTPGAVLVLRMREGAVAKHLGIVGLPEGGMPVLIHAWSGRGVVQTPLTQGWMKKVAAAFRFPQVE